MNTIDKKTEINTFEDLEIWKERMPSAFSLLLSAFCLLLSAFCLPAFSQQVLTLEQCKELALKNSAKAQNADLSVEIAQQHKKEAFTKYFPSISATGMGFMANKPMLEMEFDMSGMMTPLTDVLTPLIGWAMMNGAPIDPASLAGLQNQEPMTIEAMKNGIIAGVMATQPIFAGGQILNGNRLAKTGVEATKLQKQMSENDVLLTTEKCFWQLVSLKEKMKTIENSEILLDRILSDVKIAVEAGLTIRNDLLRIELEQNKLQSGKFKAENGMALLKMLLGLQIGLSAESFDIETPDIENIDILYFKNMECLTGKVENRLEYQLLDKSVEIANLQHKMEIGKYLPTIAVGAGYNFMNLDMHNDNGIKNDFIMGFATVSIPITDWWGGSHAIKRKKLEVLQTQNLKRENTDLLQLQTQQITNELNEAYHQISLAKKSISSAEENLKINQDNYNAGVITLSNLLEAQNLLQQSRDQYTEAATGYFVKLAEYKRFSMP